MIKIQMADFLNIFTFISGFNLSGKNQKKLLKKKAVRKN